MIDISKISSPSDIKTIPISNLNFLAEDIRKKILQTVSNTGGHLSSNLGIVDLVIALHYVFSSPDDKFIFDTSHQTYAHKLLTGRFKNFSTLRQLDGISGFSNPKESEHDHFYCGHAGTVLSLALGMVHGRENNEHIIPIIGDGSLNCGLILEALNHIPKNLKNFIVILNDNEMAISKNVGNIKNILSRLVNNPISNKVFSEIQNLLSKIPAYGKVLANQGKKITESIKHLVSSASFFEQFGLTYIGPIDGHNIKKMIDTFNAIKYQQVPIIVHVITKKGKGLQLAIENPTPYHGVNSLDIKTGEILKKVNSSTFPKVFGKEIVKLAETDKSIIAISPAMIEGSAMTEFMNKFPDRCFDVGIAEGHAVTFAGGLSYQKNKKVIICIYSTFLQRTFDNLFHDICLQQAPVIFAIDRAGLNGPDGTTHHGIYDIGFLNSMPNMIICQPRNANILKAVLNNAFSWNKPVAIRYPNREAENSKIIPQIIPGKAEILSEGKDILILALGDTHKIAFEVKELLNSENISPTIVDPIFIKPLDEELLKKLFLTHSLIITLEEHSINCGFSIIVNSFIAKNNFSINIINFALPDEFIEHGNTQKLLKKYGLDAKYIAKKIINHFNKREEAKEINDANSYISI